MATSPNPSLPWEIIFQIISEAARTHPISFLFQTRLVNSTFATEIFNNILTHNRLDVDWLSAFNSNYRQRRKKPRCSFPERLKRKFLYQRIKLSTQPRRPCDLTRIMHEYLESEQMVQRAQYRNIDTETQIQEFVDVLVGAANGPLVTVYLDTDLDSPRSKDWHTLQAHRARQEVWFMLIFSAIMRDDPGDVKLLMEDAFQGLMDWSRLFLTCPFRVIAEEGSPAVLNILFQYGDWPDVWSVSWRTSRIERTLKFAIEAGNFPVVDLWLDECPTPRGSRTFPPVAYAVAFVELARAGEVKRLRYLNEQWAHYTAPALDPTIRLKAFIEAIKASQVDTAEFLADQRTFDINSTAPGYTHGPLFPALHDCKPAVRLAMVQMLLSAGADPNRTYPGVRGTPLQAALKQQDPEQEYALADLLLENGADPNARVGKAVNKMRAPLLYAARRGQIGLVHWLFEHGADPRIAWGQLTLIDEARRGNVLEKVKVLLKEFGWDERMEKWLEDFQDR
ncbi:ankyrin repeat-containing domain protein [Aspergillus californicus]